MDDCVFCKIAAGTLPSVKIFENELILVILDIMPLSEGHLLVLPKAHYETIFDMNETLAAEIMKVTWKVANVIRKAIEPDGLNLQQNNYPAASQVVPHFHMHLIPRHTGDGLSIGRWKAQKGDPARLEEVGEQIRQMI